MVIYSVDARGLTTLSHSDSQEALAYLSEQTGGFPVLNTNDLARGLARIVSNVGSYYIVGYEPERGTFAGPGQKPALHKIGIEVTRPGVKVRSRREFLGVSDRPDDHQVRSPAQRLVRAALSPLAETDIAVRATTLPAFSPGEGMFVRALLHIDARPLAFVDGGDGKRTASADVFAVVMNAEGAEVGHLSTGFSVSLTPEANTRALREGLAYSFRIPIQRPGGYQVRFAVRDRNSGVLGSTGEFTRVEDAAGGVFSLSGINLRQCQVGHDVVAAESESDAVRVYAPGASLTYAYRSTTPPIPSRRQSASGAARRRCSQARPPRWCRRLTGAP